MPFLRPDLASQRFPELKSHDADGGATRSASTGSRGGHRSAARDSALQNRGYR